MKPEILVVEDSATQAEAVRSLLEETYVVTMASSAEEALEILGRSAFHLVLSDIVMPGMSGYDLCRRIKEYPGWRSTPVVLLTSLADPLDIVRGLEAGADNYITKPFEGEHLLARIQHVLENRRRRQRARTSMEVSVNFLGTELVITSDKEQILDLLLSSIEDIIRTNRALEESRQELARAHAQLERYAREKEREAASSTERYRTLMESAGDAIMVLHPDGTITEANACAARLLGRAQHEIVGRNLAEFVEDDQRAEVQTTLERLATEDRVNSSERKLVRSDGTTVLCEGTASVAQVGDESLILAIYRDITARKETEATLRRQRTHLRQAQEIARVGSFERDVQTNLVTFTDQIARIYGLPPHASPRPLDELLELMHPEDREAVREVGCLAVEQRRPFEVEFRVQGADGVLRIASARGRAEIDERGEVRRILGVMQDVTQQRALERQLLQAQKMEAIGRLAGGVAHDFNNVLMAIKGSLHFLAEDLGPKHPSREDLEDIGTAVQRATRLTRQLLAFSRQQVVQPQPVDLAELVQEQRRMLIRLVPEDIEIRTATEPDLWSVTADPGQMEQVFMNLVVNARDAMPDGGTISITLANAPVRSGSGEAMAGVKPGEYVRLTFSDSGEGIQDDVLEHIFEPFFTTKAAGLGTGLGLSTVYGIVQQTGGHILVDGNAGGGATFHIFLPRALGSPAQPGPREAAGNAARPTGTILLVEDQPEVRRSLARVLRRHGHRVHEASGGPEALEIFREAGDAIDLVITDIVMPKMSGVELAERLRQIEPDLPFLLMSGYLDDEVARRGLSRAGAHYIEKPFEHEDLVRKVGSLLSAGSDPDPPTD